jgi:uncharacterized protein YndB with AHSA1/START domain
VSRVLSVSRVISAPAQQIFDLLADPEMHPVLDGGGTVRSARDGNPDRLSLGAKFGMNMRLGTPYPIVNTVVEFDEGRRIAWCHFAKNVWRYELEPVPGGTKVTESFDQTKSRPGTSLFVRALGFRERNRKAMEQTLHRLEQHVAQT